MLLDLCLTRLLFVGQLEQNEPPEDENLSDLEFEAYANSNFGQQMDGQTASDVERRQTSKSQPKSQWTQQQAPHRRTEASSRRAAISPLWSKSSPVDLHPDEASMFENLQKELENLGQRMELVEQNNAQQLEHAQQEVYRLQQELILRDEEIAEAAKSRALQAERHAWQSELSGARNQLDQLRQRLEEREQLVQDGFERTDKSLETIYMQADEIESLRDVLNAQRAEIQRLNRLLDRLVGMRPDEVHPLDVANLQHDIHALRSTLGGGGGGSGYQSPQCFQQPTHVCSQPNLSQNMTTTAPAQQQLHQPTNYSVPSHASPYGLQHMSHSTPMLNTLPVDSGNVMATRTESQLLCNVPEHHQLEDYVAALQRKIRELKHRLNEKQEVQHEEEIERLRRLRERILHKKDVLEEMNLEMESRRAKIEGLSESENQLNHEVQRLKLELDDSVHQKRLLEQRHSTAQAQLNQGIEAEEASFISRRNHLQQELSCVEETLIKRRTELNKVQQQLGSSQLDLERIKDTAAASIAQYEEARVSWERATKEGELLEKRSHEAATELLRANNDAEELREEVLQLEAKKCHVVNTLSEVQLVLAVKDSEFQAIELRSRQAAESLARVQQDLQATLAQERSKLDALAEADALLDERRAESDRLQSQLQLMQHKLEDLNRVFEQLRTDAQLLEQQVQNKRAELTSTVREAEKEDANRQRERREMCNILESLREEKNHLLQTIENHKSERDQLRDDADREQQVLQNLTSAIGKQKVELKHLLEMMKLEQAEVDKVNHQYTEKLTLLERTQASLHDQRAELAECEMQQKRKSSELERARELLSNERASLENLQTERRALEASVHALAREREMLQETSRSLESRIPALKKQQLSLEESLTSTQARLDKLSSERVGVESLLAKHKFEHGTKQKDLEDLTLAVKEARLELTNTRERLQEAELEVERVDAQLSLKLREREEVQHELRRIAEQTRVANLCCEDTAKRCAAAEQDNECVKVELAQRKQEVQDADRNLVRLRKEIEQEEVRLSKLMNNSSKDLKSINANVKEKQQELDDMSSKLKQVKQEMEQRNHTEEKLLAYENVLKDQEKLVFACNEEKQQLAKALSRAYKEVQIVRDELSHERLLSSRLQHEERLAREMQVDTQRDLQRTKKRAAKEIADLEQVAQEHCNRAAKLAENLQSVQLNYMELRKKVLSQSEIVGHELQVADSMRLIRQGLQSELSRSVEQLQLSSADAVDELSDLADQRQQVQRYLETLKDNLAAIRNGSSNNLRLPHSMLSNGDESLSEQAQLDAIAAAKAQLRAKLQAAEFALTVDSRRSAGTLEILRHQLDQIEDNTRSDSNQSPLREHSNCDSINKTNSIAGKAGGPIREANVTDS